MCGTSRLVLVLGMHRSGTSAMARSLQCLGIDLGEELIGAHPCNPKGFFEDATVYACNRALLAMQGLVWHSLTRPDAASLKRLAQEETGRQALELLHSKTAGRPVLGLKDPRMSRLLPFWRPLIAAAGLRVHIILALRHPAGVAHSLARRDGMTAEHSHALWLWYTLEALAGSAGLPCLITDYELLLARPEYEILRIGTFLKLTPHANSLAEFSHGFLDKTLCHYQAAQHMTYAASPWENLAMLLYDALRPLARQEGPLEVQTEARLAALSDRLTAQAQRLSLPAETL